MSMKKTDLDKNMGKKLDGRMKGTQSPPRFGPGSAQAVAKRDKAAPDPAVRMVSVACRLPADLATRLRERATGVEGGVSAIVAQAVERWLASSVDAA